MHYLWLADIVMVLHLAFVVFVVLGGFLVLRRPRLAWLHLPVALWGAIVEYAGLTCPLTPLESALRRRAGQESYAGGFIEHYLTASLYPAGLTREHQVLLGTIVVAINVVIYWQVAKRHRRTAR